MDLKRAILSLFLSSVYLVFCMGEIRWHLKEPLYGISSEIFPLSKSVINPLNPELNPICCLLTLLGTHHFLHVSKIRVKSLTLRLLMSYIYIYGISSLRVNHPVEGGGQDDVNSIATRHRLEGLVFES